MPAKKKEIKNIEKKGEKLMINKKIRISKSSLKSLKSWLIGILIIGAISYASYSLINDYKQSQISQIINERNEYCNTSWKDYIETEVIPQVTEYKYEVNHCYYENQFTAKELSSLCLCSFKVFYLNDSLINDDYILLYSVFDNV